MRAPNIEDAEAFTVALLDAYGITASTRLQKLSDGSVRIGRVGGDRPTAISDRPTMLVECWHSSTVEAATLAGQIHDILFESAGRVQAGWHLKSVSLTGPVNYPDPDAPTMARYQFTASLLVRLAA